MPNPQALSTLIGPFYSPVSSRTLVFPFCWICPAIKPSHQGSGFTSLIIAFWSAKTTSLGLLTQPRFSDPLAPPWSSDPLAPPWLVHLHQGPSFPWLHLVSRSLSSSLSSFVLGLQSSSSTWVFHSPGSTLVLSLTASTSVFRAPSLVLQSSSSTLASTLVLLSIILYSFCVDIRNN